MSIGGFAMRNILTGVIAVVAIAAFAGAAQAEHVCQWTGSVWACGDGSVFSEYYPQSAGPNTLITAVPTVTPSGEPALTREPRPY
jgi:hypothetical protein